MNVCLCESDAELCPRKSNLVTVNRLEWRDHTGNRELS